MPAQPEFISFREASREPAGRYWVVAAAVLTLAVSLALAFLPTVSTATSIEGTYQESRESLIQSQGATVIVPLMVPVILSAVPLLVPVRYRFWATIGSAALFAAFVLVAMASVGMFYLPSAALLGVAAARALVVATARTGKYR